MILRFICLMFLLFITDITYSADVFKWLRVGNVRYKVWDDGSQSESSGIGNGYYYYPQGNHGQEFYYDGFLRVAGSRWGCSNWTDETGRFYPVKLAGTPYGLSDNPDNTFSLPLDEFSNRLKVYWRYPPPSVIVNEIVSNEPMFPFEEVNPDMIMGTADIMIESHIRNWMGLDINARVLAWSQHNHDDYSIWDWTATNTGNIDRDDYTELPNQTLTGLYFMRQAEYFPNPNMKEWTGVYGQHPGDSLRIMYNYPAQLKSYTYDRVGFPQPGQNGWLREPIYSGEVMIHADTEYNDEKDDITQPQMTSQSGPGDIFLKDESGRTTETDWLLAYNIMELGYVRDFSGGYEPGIYPGTHHGIPMEKSRKKYISDFDWWSWHQVISNSCGPYTLPPGQDLHFVWASVGGSISPRMGWDIGTAWYNDQVEPPPGMVYGITDNMPPQYKLFPSLYNDPAFDVPDRNIGAYSNWAKDCWVFTGKDSIFQNGNNARKNFEMNYDIPIPPSPPSVKIRTLPDNIRIMWDGTESEKASDFAGYRIYRAVPTKDSTFFKRIADIPGKGTYQFDDLTVKRYVGYIYYVTAYDDGVGNKTDVNGRKEVLESGKYLNITNLHKAYLTRPTGDKLSDIRVVPNPFNINTVDRLIYFGEERKVTFVNLPGYCTIKIYTESGDLINTIQHTSGSGDETWGHIEALYLTNSSGQLVVSGIYIALIQERNEDWTLTGNEHYIKILIVM